MKTDITLFLAAFLLFTIIQIYAMPGKDPLNVWQPYFGKNVKKSEKNDKPIKETVKEVSVEKDDGESEDSDDDSSDDSDDSNDSTDDSDDSTDDSDDSTDDSDGSNEDASIEDTDDDPEDEESKEDKDDDDDDDEAGAEDDTTSSDEDPPKKSLNKKGDDAKKETNKKQDKDAIKVEKPKKKSSKPPKIKMGKLSQTKEIKSSKTKNKGKGSKSVKKSINLNQGPKGDKGDRGPKGEPGDGSSPSIPMQAALSTVLTNHFGPAKDTIVPFDLVLLDLGDNYDNDTGIFICTIPGTYVVSLYLMSHPGAKVNARIYINNRPIAALWADDNKNVGFYPSSSIQTVTRLEFGDQVYVMLVDGGYGESWVHANYNAFTVYLLYEDTFMKKRR